MEFYNGENEKQNIQNITKINPIIYGFLHSKSKTLYSIIESTENKIDSVEVEKDNKKYKVPNIVITPSNNTIYKDFKNSLFRKEYSKLGVDFSIKDKLTNFEWIISDEIIDIKGFMCKKAISKKEKYEIIAWFCEEIPVNTGPDRFWGLPGLILRIEFGKFSTITIDQIKIIQEEINIEEPNNKSKFITLKELKEKEIQMIQERKNEN